MFNPAISKIWQTRETIIITKFKRSKITPSHNHATLLLHNISFRETEKVPIRKNKQPQKFRATRYTT